MKSQADKNRSERTFAPGDMVYMKLQPYVKTSVANRSNKKLSFRYYGPFQVLQKIGAVAYKLDLPQTSKIHPVLHVSQLKRCVPKDVQVSADLTSVCTDPAQAMKPEKRLDTRMIQRGTNLIKQALIKWDALPEAMATWEDEVEIQRKFKESPPA